jgi:hypothetical protein
METLWVSPEYEIVIPPAVTKALNVQPGQRVQAILYQGRIELIPIGPPASARGFLTGIDTDIEHDEQ